MRKFDFLIFYAMNSSERCRLLQNYTKLVVNTISLERKTRDFVLSSVVY